MKPDFVSKIIFHFYNRQSKAKQNDEQVKKSDDIKNGNGMCF